MRNLNTLGSTNDNFAKIHDIPSKLIFGNLDLNAKKTICLPIYGIGKHLKETIDNIQTYIDDTTQVIISNNSGNHGDDNKIELLCAGLCRDRVAYFQTDRELGQLNNFNRCIELAQTDYMCFLHDDDLLVDYFFKYYTVALDFMKKNPRAGMIHELFSPFYIEPKIVDNTEPFSVHEITQSTITHTGYSGTEIPSCGMILKKNAAMEAGGFNDEFPSSGDAFLSISMMSRGYKIYQSNNVTGYYRIDSNISTKLETSQGFVLEDSMFRKVWSSKGLMRKAYMKFFDNYLYSKSIDNKVEAFAPMNKEISIENLDFKGKYKNYGRYSLRRVLYVRIFKLLSKTQRNIKLEE